MNNEWNVFFPVTPSNHEELHSDKRGGGWFAIMCLSGISNKPPNIIWQFEEQLDYKKLTICYPTGPILLIFISENGLFGLAEAKCFIS